MWLGEFSVLPCNNSNTLRRRSSRLAGQTCVAAAHPPRPPTPTSQPSWLRIIIINPRGRQQRRACLPTPRKSITSSQLHHLPRPPPQGANLPSPQSTHARAHARHTTLQHCHSFRHMYEYRPGNGDSSVGGATAAHAVDSGSMVPMVWTDYGESPAGCSNLERVPSIPRCLHAHDKRSAGAGRPSRLRLGAWALMLLALTQLELVPLYLIGRYFKHTYLCAARPCHDHNDLHRAGHLNMC